MFQRQRGVPDVIVKYIKACRKDSPAESIRAVYKVHAKQNINIY